jgi:hypothetical protein
MAKSSAPKALQKSYLAGKVSARIRWNTKGDFTRCVSQAKKHGMTPPTAKGFCANMHKLATGSYPGGNKKIKK